MTITGSSKVPGNWLLLVFSLPSKKASQRVQIWRKLKKYGALPLPSAGYLLPNTAQHQEQFEWLSAAIRKFKGQASVIQVDSIDELPTEKIISLFVAARSSDYGSLIRDIKKVPSAKRSPAQLTALRRRFQEIAAIDFFESPLRSRVEGLLSRLDGQKESGVSNHSKQIKKEYLDRVWITRPRPGIDRVSSAWLIRTFIDRNAKFVFDSDPEKHPDAIPFDMFHAAGFGHRGEDCTFETLRKEFGIRDPKVKTIAEIIHDADLGDEKFGRSEGIGLDHVLIGWAQQGVSDEELLRRGVELIEGLYHHQP